MYTIQKYNIFLTLFKWEMKSAGVDSIKRPILTGLTILRECNFFDPKSYHLSTAETVKLKLESSEHPNL